MRVAVRRALVLAVIVVAITGACEKQDVTKAVLDADVITVYANLQAKRDSLLGAPVRQGVRIQANCFRGGPKQPDVGAGKDWRCDITGEDSTGPSARSYLVIVRANACWTALAETLTAKAETVDVITMTDPRTGADLPDPLGGFDGCVQA